MTLQDLPTSAVGPATVSEIPTVSTATSSWMLQDHIDAEHFAALRAMAGLTVSPDVLAINGRAHIIDQNDNNDV